MEAWTRQHGGEVMDASLERVRTVGLSLTAQTPEPLRFHVLQNQSLTAFSWPSGDVFVSAGLVGAASDDEIAAAIAHEIGHLVHQPEAQGTLALRGAGTSLDAEQGADVTGLKVLRASNRPPEALITLLEKVRATADSPQLRADLATRISLLRAASH